MRISNCLLAVCVAVGPLTIRAADNALTSQVTQPAQTPLATLAQAQTTPAPDTTQPATVVPAQDQATAVPTHRSDKASIDKAREALRQKMEQLSHPQTEAVQPPAAPIPTPPPTSAPAAATPAPAPAPAVAPAAAPAAAAPAAAAAPPAVIIPPSAAPALVAEQSSGVPVPADDALIEKARTAVRQKTAELEGQSQAAPLVPAAAVSSQASPPATAQQTQPVPAPAPAPEPHPAVAAVAATTTAPVTTAPAPAALTEPGVPEPSDPAAIEKAREAMRQKMQEVLSQTPPEMATTQKPIPVSNSSHTVSKKAGAFPPLQGPPSGLSADKEQRLQSLLAKYRADEISPEQYHAERAKIIGEP